MLFTSMLLRKFKLKVDPAVPTSHGSPFTPIQYRIELAWMMNL